MRGAMLSHSLKPVLKGLLTWVPGVQQAFYDASAGGGTQSATYCYGVWLKHLTLLWHHGMRAMPRTVVELGPGASLGTGLAALLSGAERYIAVDTVRHARPDTTLAALQQLVTLFAAYAPRPRSGWPDFDHLLDARLFPAHILTPELFRRTLAPERIASLQRDIGRLQDPSPQSAIRYATWKDRVPIEPGSADLVFSHAVFCHVEQPEEVYANCARWLKPGGWMSHQTDFSSLGVTEPWNGHYQYGERTWKLVAGRRPYFVSRAPCSEHLRLLRKHGFEIVTVIRGTRDDGLSRSQLAPRWRELPDEDLRCWSAFIIARKPA